MPANADFAFDVLVGGIAIQEYEKDGRYFVESNLSTLYPTNIISRN